MRRREFMALGGAAAVGVAAGSAARAQQRIPRVAILLFGPAADGKQLPLAAELARLGYEDGRTIAYEVRGADGDVTRFPALARELAAARPDVMVGATSPAATALAQSSATVPIVMTVVGDPVALRLTDSMSRPTGNVTGFTLSSPSLAGKRLELMRELIPGLRKVLYLFSTSSPMEEAFERQVRLAAESLGIALTAMPLTSVESVGEAFARGDDDGVQAALVETNPTLVYLGGHILNECMIRDLPAVHAWFFQVRAGALMSYGPAVVENLAGAARYVDRVLKGARIAELPFEEPTHIKLAINLKTARTLKLTIPPMLLARADEVIE